MSRAPKARLASGTRVTVANPQELQPGLGSAAPVIRTEAEKGDNVAVRAGRSVASLVLISLLLIIAIYVALASTLMVILGANGDRVLVLRGAFAEGQAPAGEYVYASSNPVDYSLFGKIDAAVFGVPNGSVLQIVSGNNSVVSTAPDGTIVVDGKPTPYKGKVDSMTLTREHVALCVKGACTPGQTVRISQRNILGQAKGRVTPSGVKPYAPSTGTAQ